MATQSLLPIPAPAAFFHSSPVNGAICLLLSFHVVDFAMRVVSSYPIHYYTSFYWFSVEFYEFTKMMILIEIDFPIDKNYEPSGKY